MNSLFLSYEWCFRIAALVIAGGTALLLLWALLGDRMRGRRRCPRCWYLMEGVPGLVCPECGRAAKSEAGLFRTRRRWRQALYAMLLACVGYGVWVAPIVNSRGFLAAVPRPILIGWVEAKGWPKPKSGSWSEEVMHRHQAGLLGWWDDLARRRMLRRWTMEYRDRWPSGVPVRIKPTALLWFSDSTSGGALRARLVNGESGYGPWFRLGLAPSLSTEWWDGSIEIGTPLDGAKELMLEVECYRKGTSSRAEPTWTSRVSFPMAVGGTLSDIMEPVASKGLDGAIVANLTTAVSSPWNQMLLPIARSPDDGDVVIGIRIEYLNNSRTVAIARICDSSVGRGHVFDVPIRWLAVEEIGMGRHFKIDEVHIVPDAGTALLDFKSTRCWSGDIRLRWDQSAPPK